MLGHVALCSRLKLPNDCSGTDVIHGPSLKVITGLKQPVGACGSDSSNAGKGSPAGTNLQRLIIPNLAVSQSNNPKVHNLPKPEAGLRRGTPAGHEGGRHARCLMRPTPQNGDPKVGMSSCTCAWQLSDTQHDASSGANQRVCHGLCRC